MPLLIYQRSYNQEALPRGRASLSVERFQFPVQLPVRGYWLLAIAYRLAALGLIALGVSQSGKKVLASIFDVCPRVALLNVLKYGRSVGCMHGSPTPPHGYPLITPLDASLCV
jgi:hypothetical protein